MKHSKRSRSERRAEAEARQKARERRTAQEQLDVLSKRPGASKHESARLGGIGVPTAAPRKKLAARLAPKEAKSGKDFRPMGRGH